MAWTNIDNALVSVGALPFATTIQALRDNPIAIANGDAGAPRVQTAGIANNAITAAKLPVATVQDRISNMSVGSLGTYAFLSVSVPAGTTRSPGFTTAGSNLDYGPSGGASPSGTWRLMGRIVNPSGVEPATGTSVWLRIS
jgi:hypothetical protein